MGNEIWNVIATMYTFRTISPIETLKALKYFSANPSFDMYKITDVNGGLWIAAFGDDIYIKIITTSPFWYLSYPTCSCYTQCTYWDISTRKHFIKYETNDYWYHNDLNADVKVERVK